MRWGIAFLAWTLAALYLANGCLDHVRVWHKPPRGYTRERVLPYLETCAKRKTLRLAGATVLIVSLYFGSGWVAARLRAGREKEEPADRDLSQ